MIERRLANFSPLSQQPSAVIYDVIYNQWVEILLLEVVSNIIESLGSLGGKYSSFSTLHFTGGTTILMLCLFNSLLNLKNQWSNLHVSLLGTWYHLLDSQMPRHHFLTCWEGISLSLLNFAEAIASLLVFESSQLWVFLTWFHLSWVILSLLVLCLPNLSLHLTLLDKTFFDTTFLNFWEGIIHCCFLPSSRGLSLCFLGF